ncbi:MAG: Asp-tRNA(Asn)/Glu-tRNA(Gln) amidotransferase GatCAB subunit B, partial [Candidatus Eremiobacteraeota bacterium]|nr:Asp-tRNA(Asn)/Glu-tRNA(Gln) amidotransferase GatCAB subunit B [Candidatus Eremiobacteraeota bacterium]
KELGVKTEVKNMNSLRSIRDAIESERARQIEVLESGGRVVQETRGWDETTGTTISMRSKEEAQDYRYFPEPDLPSLVFNLDDVAKVDAELPELPAARRERYGKQFGLDQPTLDYLTTEAFFGQFFEETVALGGEASEVAKWMSNTISRLSNEREMHLRDSKLTTASLGELLKMIDAGDVGAKSGQKVLEVLFAEGGEAGKVVDKLGLRQLSSTDSLIPILQSVIESNQPIVAQFKEGKEKALNVLVGKVMKETRGAANPGLTKTMLEELIGASD